MLPERELIMRSVGQYRTLTISSRMQITAIVLFAAFLCATIAVLGFASYGQFRANAERAALFNREARIAESEERVEAFRGELEQATLQLQRRQAFLEEMIEMLPADVVAQEGEAGSSKEGGEKAGVALSRIGTELPEAAGLARIEKRQLAAVSALTSFADRRAAKSEQVIRRLGLDPRSVIVAAQGAMGGPLEELATEADGSLDPRFKRLGASLSRMAALDHGLTRIPQIMPTDLARMTSNFGYRHDPFTGDAAMHSGLDFGGRTGDPIHAAAAGRVSFVGTRGGYGNVVEISHGNGLMTRYAHMSSSKARVGQTVAAGEVIGAIGSTGRSTGPHLHFEVRIGDRAVNPRPFLETAPDLLEEIRS